MARLIYLVSLVSVLCHLPPVFAQSSGTGNDFETNQWGFLISNQWSTDSREAYEKYRMYYRFGRGFHRNHNDKYRQHLLDNLYVPGSEKQIPVSIICTDNKGQSFQLTKKAIDEFLEMASLAGYWHRLYGFPEIDQKFSSVPKINKEVSVDEDGNETVDLKIDTSRYTNIVVCSGSEALASVAYNERQAASINALSSVTNLLAIASGYPDAAEVEPAARMTVGHELAHVFQNVMLPISNDGQADGQAAQNLTEGFAQATGMLFTFDTMGSDAGGGSLGHHAVIDLPEVAYDNDDTFEFFMVRAYNVPLLLSENRNEHLFLSRATSNDAGRELLNTVDEWAMSSFSYQTTGFYFHLLERYLEDNPFGIKPLYDAIDQDAAENLYPALNSFLDKEDGVRMKGLPHVLPQFHAEYADWWDYPRTDDPKLNEDNWLNYTFGGCKTIDINDDQTANLVDFKLAKFAGSCVDIEISGDIVTANPEIELLLTSGNGNVREVYGSVVRITGIHGDIFSCFEFAEKKGVKDQNCLIDPIDGLIENYSLLSASDSIARHFYVGPIYNWTGEPIKVRVMFTHVPEDLENQNGINADAQEYRLTVAVDAMAVEGPAMLPNGAEVSEDGGAAFTGTGPNQPFATGRPSLVFEGSNPSQGSAYQDMLAGGLDIPGLAVFQQSGAGAQSLFGFAAESEQGAFNVLLGLEKVPAYGELGRFEIYPLGGGHFAGDGDEVGAHNPKKKSFVDIISNTPDELIYEAEINICTFTSDELQAEIFAERDRDYCEFGRERTYFIRSSVAFPELVPGASRLGRVSSFEPLPPTAGYEKYKNLRLSKLGAELGNYYDPANELEASTGPASQSQDQANRPQSTGTFSQDAPSQTCNCECDGKAEFERLEQLSQIPTNLKACKLLCGKQWQSCGG